MEPILRIGDHYSRDEIRDIYGGDLHASMPHKDGVVVCGCFNPEYNPDAPSVILIGKGKNVVKYARILVTQNNPIPIFLRRAPKRWQYMGQYRAGPLSVDAKEVSKRTADSGRNNVVAVLWLSAM